MAKAIGAGADFVMLGGMLAGHDQSGGEVIEKDGKKFKQFYGMSSATAMQKHKGGVAEYRASEGKTIFSNIEFSHIYHGLFMHMYIIIFSIFANICIFAFSSLDILKFAKN